MTTNAPKNNRKISSVIPPPPPPPKKHGYEELVFKIKEISKIVKKQSKDNSIPLEEKLGIKVLKDAGILDIDNKVSKHYLNITEEGMYEYCFYVHDWEGVNYELRVSHSKKFSIEEWQSLCEEVIVMAYEYEAKNKRYITDISSLTYEKIVPSYFESKGFSIVIPEPPECIFVFDPHCFYDKDDYIKNEKLKEWLNYVRENLTRIIDTDVPLGPNYFIKEAKKSP